jgi:aspartate aminotransferase
MKINSPSFFIGLGGGDLISFGSGQPDMAPPQSVFEVLKGYNSFKYSLVQGQDNLREALAKQYRGSSKENFIITNGASEAIDLALRAINKEGGVVLLPKPYYYSYPHNAELAGFKKEYYDLKNGKINLEEFKVKVKKAVAVIINSPGNPTGTVQETETLREIEKLSAQLGFYIISDEVYKDLVYDQESYLMQGEKTITINSFSKTFGMCGYRIGYAYAREQLVVDRMVEIKTHTSMNTSIIGQEMAHEATKVPQAYIENQTKIWKARRDMIYEGLMNLGLELWKPEGAFYVFPKLKNPNKVVNDLYYKYKVITYDGAWFGDPERVRFSYALDVEKIEEGLKRLKEYLGKEYKYN